MAEDKKNQEHLYRQLVRLGDMIGDGLDQEPGGAWIRREYKATMKALGLTLPARPRAKNPHAAELKEKINRLMLNRVNSVCCPECKTLTLKQLKSGSLKAQCTTCKQVYQLLKRGKA